MTPQQSDVLVIGAGMAGLTAARTLAEAGQRVVVLEARDRIGGRILTQRVANENIELGAEFIHGRAPELWAIIDEAGLSTYERDGIQFCYKDAKLAPCSDMQDEFFRPLEALEDFTGRDLTFAEYLDSNPLPEDQRNSIIHFVEGFNAADHRQISAASLGAQQKAENSIEGDLAFHLRRGYDQLPAFLADQLAKYNGDIRLSTPIHELRWQTGHVEALTSNGSFTARQAVITLPLGVLQNGSVSITPRPEPILAAAARMRMGSATRLTFLFREPFWHHLSQPPHLDKLSFLFAFSQMPPVWWTPHPEPASTITGWVGGPRSAALSSLNPDELAHQACKTLAAIFSLEPVTLHQSLIGCYAHDWQHDPYALGAYSYVAAGGLDAPAQLSQPIANTLFFAGEHTDTTAHWGTVHAAIRSGLRAAAQILDLPPG